MPHIQAPFFIFHMPTSRQLEYSSSIDVDSLVPLIPSLNKSPPLINFPLKLLICKN
eukprot:c24619_g4_i1 orf=149-316(+)